MNKMCYRIFLLTVTLSVALFERVVAQTNAYQYNYVDPSIYDSLGYLPSGTDALIDVTVPVGNGVPNYVVKWNESVNTYLPIQVILGGSAFPGSNQDLQATDAQNELDTAETWWNQTMSSTGNCFSVQAVPYGGAEVLFTSNADYFNGKAGAEALAVTASAVNGTDLGVDGDVNSPNPTAGILFNNSSNFQSQYEWSSHWYTVSFAQYINFQNVAVHELGHLFGLGDDYADGNSVMFYAQSPNQSELYLDRTDVYAMERLYCGVLTGVVNNPPPAPMNFSLNIVGQNVVLNWSETPGVPISSFEVYKNGSVIAGPSGTSYTDANGASSLPATYQVGADSYYPGPPYYLDGESDTQPIKVIAAPSTVNYDTLWTGAVYVNSNVTISSGATVYISAATKVIFNVGNNYSLTVNGKLEVEGASFAPVIFTSNSSSPSPGDWGSIVLNGSGANASTIDYADIDYGTEVKVNQANNVTIENCNIYDNYYHGIEAYYASGLLAQSDTIANANANHGILITGGSSNNCYQNVIYKTNHGRNGAGIEYAGSSGIVTENDIEYYNWGIGAIWGASPTSYVSAWNGPQRNNRITNCIYGLMVYHQSYPNFGPVQTSPYSYNSIYSNTYNVSLDADNYNTYALPAAGNYWATSNPTPTFVVGSGSQVNWQAVDAYDPWSGVPLPTSSSRLEENHVPVASAASRMTGPENEVQSASSSPDLQDSLLIGVELRDQKKSNEARSYFMTLIARHPDMQAAYVDLYSCADSQSIPAIINFFRNLPPQASEEQKPLLANLYMEEGKGSFATQVNDETIIKNPNTSLAAEAELSNFYIDLNVDNSPASAAQILAQVEGEASLLEGTELSDAEAALKFYVDPNTGKMPNMGSQQSALGSQPQVNVLAQNYPNPFNPTTVVSYNLKSAGHVTLKVYDVLGREVMTLVDGYQNAGVHSADFNGANLASGVYFYRLTAPGVSQVKKMLLVK